MDRQGSPGAERVGEGGTEDRKRAGRTGRWGGRREKCIERGRPVLVPLIFFKMTALLFHCQVPSTIYKACNFPTSSPTLAIYFYLMVAILMSRK